MDCPTQLDPRGGISAVTQCNKTRSEFSRPPTRFDLNLWSGSRNNPFQATRPKDLSAAFRGLCEQDVLCLGMIEAPHRLSTHGRGNELAAKGLLAVQYLFEPKHLLRDSVERLGNAELMHLGYPPRLQCFAPNTIPERSFAFNDQHARTSRCHPAR